MTIAAGDIVSIEGRAAIFEVYRIREDGKLKVRVVGSNRGGRTWTAAALRKVKPVEVAAKLNEATIRIRLMQERLDAVSSAVDGEVPEILIRMGFYAYGTLDAGGG